MKYRVTYKCYVEGIIYETYEIEAPNIKIAEEDADSLGDFIECSAIEVDNYIEGEMIDIKCINNG